jgi:hypothetical protein
VKASTRALLAPVDTTDRDEVVRAWARACLAEPDLEDVECDEVTLVTCFRLGTISQYGYWYDHDHRSHPWAPLTCLTVDLADDLLGLVTSPGTPPWTVVVLRMSVRLDEVDCDLFSGDLAAPWLAPPSRRDGLDIRARTGH